MTEPMYVAKTGSAAETIQAPTMDRGGCGISWVVCHTPFTSLAPVLHSDIESESPSQAHPWTDCSRIVNL